MNRFIVLLAGLFVALMSSSGGRLDAQGAIDKTKATNDLPTPYQTVENYFTLPDGRKWGAVSAVEIDKDGKSIWIAERCGANSGCPANLTMNPVLLYDASGKLVRSFGAGMIMSPHGIHVDRDGNLWVTDYSDNAPRAARGAAPGAGGDAAGRAAGAGAARGRGARGTPPDGAAAGAAAAGRGATQQADGAAPAAPARGTGPVGAAAGATVGHQVLKFSPTGTLLLSLGKAGGARDPEFFYQPNDVVTASNGDIFVAEGHGGGGRILKFDKTGKFLLQFGSAGTGPGQFNTPHALVIDSRNRIFVGDRGNSRIQLFDLNGTFIEEWRQFGRPSGLYIDGKDQLYSADSESAPGRNQADWKRGIRVGSARDGRVTAFIPDPWVTQAGTNQPMTTAPEAVAADAAGNVYGGQVTETGVLKYARK